MIGLEERWVLGFLPYVLVSFKGKNSRKYVSQFLEAFVEGCYKNSFIDELY